MARKRSEKSIVVEQSVSESEFVVHGLRIANHVANPPAEHAMKRFQFVHTERFLQVFDDAHRLPGGIQRTVDQFAGGT